MFKEHETCETPENCRQIKMCQRVLVIKVETRYEENEPGVSSLEYVIKEAKCEHPEAKEAIKEARALLSKTTD